MVQDFSIMTFVKSARSACNLGEDIEGKLSFAWATRDLSKSGVVGDPTVATREKGDCILESVSDGWVRVIKDVYAFQKLQPE
jgi:creatinine amidohydrolase